MPHDGKFKCDTGGKRLKLFFKRIVCKRKSTLHSQVPILPPTPLAGWTANVRSRRWETWPCPGGDRQVAEGVRKGVEVRKPEA